MRILAIETSCDDTGIAIIEASGEKKPAFKILSNIVSSQIKIHRKWGGVYPTLAKREHQKNLVPTLSQTLEEAKMLKKSKIQIPNSKQIQSRFQRDKSQALKEILFREELLYNNLEKFLLRYRKPKVDLIAITTGPGLEPCLWVGVNFAKALAYFWNLPIIPVNHIEAHIFANLLPQISSNPKSIPLQAGQNPKLQLKNQKIKFPAICLVVSGGHTQLILMQDFGKYKILGETRDDAAGECFDKAAKILGLGYPGGPAIAKASRDPVSVNNRDRVSVRLPRPMINQKNYDFSFSGLKTAVLYDFKNRSEKEKKSKKYIQEICFEIQQAIIDVLIKKTIKAAKDYNAKTIILGGGVAANQELRRQFQRKIKKEKLSFKFRVPSSNLCTDNGAMAGIAGYYNYLEKGAENWKKIKAEANWRII